MKKQNAGRTGFGRRAFAQRHGLRRRISGVCQHAENEERQTRQEVRPRGCRSDGARARSSAEKKACSLSN